MNKISNLFFAFFVLVIFANFINAQDESRASKAWSVQKYDLTATLPQNETDRNLSVRAILSLKNVGSSPLSRLTLRISQNAEISSVKINESAAEFTKAEEKIGGASLQRVILRTPSITSNGDLSVAVDYKLKVDENSGLAALSSVSSQFLPLSYWYPTPNSWYFARGADFAPTKLQVNAPSGQTVVFSGAQNGGVYEQKLNVQPFFVVGNWDAVSNANVTVMLSKGSGGETQKRANEIATLTNEANTFVANLLGAVPNTPLRIVSVRRGSGFSGGGTIFVDDNVFRRQKIDSQIAMNIAESIAKMWLGNVVAVSGDGFGVVREGLSRYIATQFLESKYGKDIADVERLRQRTAYAAIVKRDSPLNIVSPLDDYYFSAVANKGAMIWRIMAKRVGQEELFNNLRAAMKDGDLQLSEIRAAFSAHKPFLDYAFEQVTDMNLLVGLPQQSGNQTKVALRNAGSVAADITVTATTTGGETLSANTVIPATGFGEVIFSTNSKIIRTEVDKEKLYPQTEYFDDTAPRQFDESDPLLVIKRAFDKQDFVNAEKYARLILQTFPRYDDARIFLARSLQAQGKNAEAEKEFQATLNENLPTARTFAWANVGLGEISIKNGQAANAGKYFEDAVKADAEYGATLAARQGRIKLNNQTVADESVRSFFAQFDKAAVSNRKADVQSLLVPGEVVKFAAGLSGQTEQWQTKILQIDKIDDSNILVETNLNVKLLNRQAESGKAVFRLTKIGNVYKLSGVEMFEVR